MPITPDQIGSDENLARRVMVRARFIAPCIDTLIDDSEEQKDAIAILKGVYAEVPTAGTRRIRSKGRNGTSVTFADVASAFSADDISSLRSLCSPSPTGLPVGSFPEGRPLENMWPDEGSYS